ncbi:MAG: tetratricopeptide repeat protein [Rhodospirillaceae bacterium]
MPESGKEREIIGGLLEDAAQAYERGAVVRAKAIYSGILRLHPDEADALKRLAEIELNGGDTALALALFQRAGAVSTVDAGLCYGIATALRLMGDAKGFRLALEAALRINVNYPPALYDIAVIYQQEKDYARAQAAYQRLVAGGAKDPNTFFNAGVAAFKHGDLVGAERWFHASAMIDPKAPRPFINLAMIYRTWGYPKEAVACLERAVALAPDSAEAHWNLANALLVSGDLERGFAEYEWRFRRPGRAERKLAIPRWRGEVLGGQTLLLTLEQGIGDAIHFVRFAEQAAARGARVVMECHPGLEKLLATAPGVARTVTAGTPVPEAQCYLPLMSLPHVLGTRLETIPAPIPYLKTPEGAPPFALSGELKVGLVWRGNPKHEADDKRSVTLDLLAPLLAVPGVSWFSLQVGDVAAERDAAPAAARLIDLAPQLRDFGATASAVSALDLVISVDTAVAHLAGSLGKPVWTLIAEANDWRWLSGRGDTPWYPAMRLFRQRRGRDWQPVLKIMAHELANELANARVDALAKRASGGDG